MRAQGNEGRLGRRFAIVIGLAAAGVMAASASADFSSVHDPRGDTKCHRGGSGQDGHKPCSDSSRGNADIIRATAGHEGTWLRHTIRVVGKFRSGWLALSTDSDRTCEWYVDFDRQRKDEIRPARFGADPADCYREGPGGEGPGGRAKVEFHLHSVEVSFRESQIGNPLGYGWRAGAFASGNPSRGLAGDDVPHGRVSYIRQELG